MKNTPPKSYRPFNETFTAKPRGERELVFTRQLDAPRTLVWLVMTEPTHIPHWWGPHAATTSVEVMDVRVGGRWRFICDEAGQRHAFRGEYLELSPPDCIVQTFEYEAMPGIVTETTTLVERDGVTEVTVVSLFPSTEDRDGAMEFGMVEGSRESWERLAAVLKSLR